MPVSFYKSLFILTLLLLSRAGIVFGQTESDDKKIQSAGKKVKAGLKKDNPDTLAQGYYELGESFEKKGDLPKSEAYYQKAKELYEKQNDATGIARSSRALAKVQEDQHKNKDAIDNYATARDNTEKIGDVTLTALNGNDFKRLKLADSLPIQESYLNQNLEFGKRAGDTSEIVNNYSRLAQVNLKNNKTAGAVSAFTNAYQFSLNAPAQATYYNQQITNVYLNDKNFQKAIETKQEILKQPFVQQSTELKAKEINSLADIYMQKQEDSTAIRLLHESYNISVQNGHTLAARTSLEKLDSIYQSKGRREQSLKLYKDFLNQLPGIIIKDSSLADTRLVAETESRIKELENEKALKDDLIRRKNVFNYWLIGSVAVLVIFASAILYVLRKLRIRNKKIALQSLRREMNPHFIFNSLNSINQFIANNNELEANKYLTRFSTLMRRVMENSKEDFVSFAKEAELLEHYLELEKSRFPDKFDYKITIDDSLLAEEQLFIPGMLIQPHLENAIWHGLRYTDEKGLLQLNFSRTDTGIKILVEDNGIGMEASRMTKTDNQKKHSGRGITNTMERIKILNELYNQHITCEVEDKAAPEHGVKVRLFIPLLKKYQA